MFTYGVYTSNDIEMLITEKYIMTFRRVKSQDALESCLLEKTENSSHYSYIGICRSVPATAMMYPRPQKWEYAFQGVKKKYDNNASLAAWIGKANLTIQQLEDQTNLIFPDGDTYSATKTETICMDDLYPLPLSVDEDTIGACLQYWRIGCYQEVIEFSSKDFGISVSINTKEHMYIFQMHPNDFYCRAARYSTCNSGVVFNQNFRQRSGDLSETYMADDNRVSGDRLSVDPHGFGVCQIIDYDGLMKKYLTEQERSALCYRYGLNGFERKTQVGIAEILGISRSSVSRIQRKALKTIESVIPRPADNSIYWTVASFTDNQIILNGCQGEMWEWNKPSR
jgi:hypothetical protein